MNLREDNGTRHARALFVLSMAGEPQPAYLNVLKGHMANLTASGRAFLAMAIASSGEEGDAANLASAREVLTSKTAFKGQDDSWMPRSALNAYTLLAWLAVEPDVAEGIRDLRPGDQVIVLTWLDRARRDELATVPGDNPGSPPLGVFSTRSPNRPNPIGLHRTQVLAVEGLRIQVSELEALDGTPVIDIKPAIDRVAER